MSSSNSFKFLVECFALVPLIVLGLAGVYFHSFYQELGLNWIFSQVTISPIVFSAIPIVFKLLVGLLISVSINFLCFKNREYFLGFAFLFFTLLGLFAIELFFIGFTLDGFSVAIRESSLVIFSIIATIIFLIALDRTGFSKLMYLSILSVLLLFIEPLVGWQASKKAEELLSGSGTYSKVYFTSEGAKNIPTQLIIRDKNGKFLRKENIDWRVLQILGDKVIIIAINQYQTVGGMNKNLVRMVDYKYIGDIY